MHKHSHSPRTDKYELAAATPRTREIFVTKIKTKPSTGCWEWQGTITPEGYGQMWFYNPGGIYDTPSTRKMFAHRLALHLAGRPVPADMVVDHLCRNRACVNPDHLDIVTMGENVLRGDGAGARNARKTHCVHGHEFSDDNTRVAIVRGRPTRMCRACQRRRYAESRARRVANIQIAS